jgi:hypothetical protein
VRVRVASRLANAFILDLVKYGRHGRNVVDALIRGAISHANESYMLRDPQLHRQFATLDQDVPDALRRPVSINALANSLQVPFETVRRRTNALCAAGACRSVPGGIILPQTATSSASYRATMQFQWDRLRELYLRLRAIGLFEDLAGRGTPVEAADPPMRLAGRYVTEYVLRFTEPRILRLRDPVRALVVMDLITANTEHFEDDQGGSGAPGAEGLPPDAARQPVSVRAVSLRLGIAYETARRHLAALEDYGVCRRTPRGYVVPAEVLASGPFTQFVEDHHVQLTRLFAGLAEHGVLDAWEADRGQRVAARAATR